MYGTQCTKYVVRVFVTVAPSGRKCWRVIDGTALVSGGTVAKTQCYSSSSLFAFGCHLIVAPRLCTLLGALLCWMSSLVCILSQSAEPENGLEGLSDSGLSIY